MSEYPNINLSLDELDLVIEALHNLYLRRVKRASSPRTIKEVHELGFHQTLLQRLMAIRNNYEQVIPTTGSTESDREKIRTT